MSAQRSLHERKSTDFSSQLTCILSNSVFRVPQKMWGWPAGTLMAWWGVQGEAHCFGFCLCRWCRHCALPSGATRRSRFVGAAVRRLLCGNERLEAWGLWSFLGISTRWWTGLDSNQRTLARADLQSAAFNHSATCPHHRSGDFSSEPRLRNRRNSHRLSVESAPDRRGFPLLQPHVTGSCAEGRRRP